MIVYSSTKAGFQQDVMTNDIGGIVYDAYKLATKRSTGKAEIDSWVNSLQYMDRVLRDSDVPLEAGVAIEYHLPQTAKRIDFIVTGKDAQNRETAILIELKQWQHAALTDQDAIVITRFKHGDQSVSHPSYQAWSYKRLLEDFNQTIQEDKIQLYPCAYLHNYEQDNVITNYFYREYTQKAPAFLKNDALKLRTFIETHIKYGDKDQIMYRIEHGKIKPSKNLADNLASMLKGNREFVMIDDQKVVYETTIKNAVNASAENKSVLIVEGGPGTGKSVVAINLLVELTKRELVAQYVTRNSAPRLVYEAKLTSSFKKSHISNMFSGSGSYYAVEPNIYDCLIVDEAHRLNEKSGMFSHLGENQVKEIIAASKCSVFFIDEDQKVTLKDIGDKEEIRKWAKKARATVTELKLESQFRCNGSDGYLAWLDNTLQISDTANDTLSVDDYDFRIVDSPAELHGLIRKKNKEMNKARMVAGYCWKWVSKSVPELKDIVLDNYKATWNLNTDGQAWIIKPNSVSEVGCIHTCQGLEVDYIGVIIGPDMVARNGKIITRPEERASSDKSISGWKSKMREDPEATKMHLDAIIKNTYRTLMTRGQKACYVYFVDAETRQYFESRLQSGAQEVLPYKNALPLLDLRAAANATYENLDGYFSDGANFTWQQVKGGPFPKDRYLVRAEGDSMEPKIEDGQLCLFRRDPGGSRNGKIILCQVSGFAGDAPIALIKRYRSARTSGADGIGESTAVVLSSLNEKHEDIVLTGGEHLSVIGIFERIVEE